MYVDNTCVCGGGAGAKRYTNLYFEMGIQYVCRFDWLSIGLFIRKNCLLEWKCMQSFKLFWNKMSIQRDPTYLFLLYLHFVFIFLVFLCVFFFFFLLFLLVHRIHTQTGGILIHRYSFLLLLLSSFSISLERQRTWDTRYKIK